MATLRNALALYDAQVEKFRKSAVAAEKAWEFLPEGGEDDARELTSGTISTAELRRRNHPFARLSGPVPRYDPRRPARGQQRRGTRGQAPLRPINFQSGRLQRAIERRQTSVPGSLAAQYVGFRRSRAGGSIFVLSPEGTTRMVARGYWSDIRRRWRIRNRAFRDVYVRGQRGAMGA